MQKVAYQDAANNSTYDTDKKNDFVVGSYDKQNKWEDYDKYLMKYIDESFQEKIALDFACGPGRNIVKYNKWFKRIDGCDISENNIKPWWMPNDFNFMSSGLQTMSNTLHQSFTYTL